MASASPPSRLNDFEVVAHLPAGGNRVPGGWDSIPRMTEEPLSHPGTKGRPSARTTMADALVLKSKLCLGGEKGGGKTSLIRRYVTDQFDDHYVRTLGAKVETKATRVEVADRRGEVDMTTAIWDIMGA